MTSLLADLQHSLHSYSLPSFLSSCCNSQSIHCSSFSIRFNTQLIRAQHVGQVWTTAVAQPSLTCSLMQALLLDIHL